MQIEPTYWQKLVKKEYKDMSIDWIDELCGGLTVLY